MRLHSFCSSGCSSREYAPFHAAMTIAAAQFAMIGSAKAAVHLLIEGELPSLGIARKTRHLMLQETPLPMLLGSSQRLLW
jgi:hypothetical protein